MSEDPFSDRLKRLEDRLQAAQASRAEPAQRLGGKYTQGSLAWRMVTELVSGMLLGLALGWGFDSLFGTRPVFLVLFVLLGFAAGVRVMMRTAGEVRDKRAEGALLRDPATENGAPDRKGPGEGRGTDGG
jgi:ATP synthase protein I